MQNKLFVWLIAGGIAIAYFAFKYGNPVFLFFLLVGLGALGILIGVQTILTQSASTSPSGGLNGDKSFYMRLIAPRFGPRYIVSGTLLLFAALAMAFFEHGALEQIESSLAHTRGMGLFLAGAGLLMTVFGVIRLRAGNEAEREMKTAPFDRAEDAVLFLILGIGLLSFGVWVAVSPNTLRGVWEFFEFLVETLPPD